MTSMDWRPPSSRSAGGTASVSGSAMRTGGADDDGFYDECKAAYLSIVDSVDARVMSKSDLYQMFTNAGRCPSKRAMNSYWPESADYVTYPQFCHAMRNERMLEKNEVVSLFHQLDSRDEGLLSEEQLVSFLTQNGEKMTPSEMNQVLAEMSEFKRDGRYDYLKFASKVVESQNKSREKFNIGGGVRKRRGSTSSLVNEKTVKKMQNKLSPKNLHKWNRAAFNGFMVFGENSALMTTQYRLDLSASSSVFLTIEPRTLPNVDKTPSAELMCAIAKLGSDDSISEIRCVTDGFDGQRFCITCDLVAGSYIVFPFTYSNDLVPRKSQPEKTELVDDDRSSITPVCRKALETLFALIDLDDDNAISREELSIFQLACTDEAFGESDWATLESMWEVVDGRLTSSGFFELNTMEAKEDPNGLWNSFEKMGFNHALQLDECCPFLLAVHTEKDCMGLKVEQRLAPLKFIDAKLIAFTNKLENKKQKQIDDISIMTTKSNQIGFISVQNSRKTIAKVKLDLSKCSNIKLGSDFKTITLQANSSKIAQVCVPKDPSREIVIKMAAEVKD